MFYSSQLLSRKTPLGICWLASHLESKRLKRAQVFEVSISQSCDSIINPEAPLALRLSGQLLLGVVRIYQRKLTFLETDAKNAIDGIQRKEGASQNVDLPDGGTAPEMTITLPETEMLGGSELFPSFAIADTPGGNALIANGGTFRRLSLGAESLTLADDISDVFGSTRWTGSEERFDLVGGEDIDRRFSAELERLRSQAAVEAPRDAGGDMFYDGAGEDSFGGAPFDEIMEPPGEDLFLVPQPSQGVGPTPGSTGGVPLPGMADMKITPPSLGFSDALPDLGTVGTGPSSRSGPSPARQQGGMKKRRHVQLDVGSDGRPATQLPSDEIRKLLNNRSPLLKNRGLNAGDVRGIAVPHGAFDVSAAISVTGMYRPACFARLAPEVMQVFSRAFGTDTDGGDGPTAHRAGKAAKATAGSTVDAAEATEGPFAASPPEHESPLPSWGDAGIDFDDDADADFAQRDVIEVSQEGAGGAVGAELKGDAPALAFDDVHRSSPLGEPQSLFRGMDEVEEGEDEGTSIRGHSRDGFTARTKIVLEHLQDRFAPTPGSKRRHPSSSSSALTLGIESLALDSLVAGKSRLEACRWFFEALVLRNKGFVDLEQAEPYGQVTIRPLQKLMEGEGVPGTSVRPSPVSEFAPTQA